MPTTIEALIAGAWVLLLAITGIFLSGRLARSLQKFREEEPSAELFSRYRLGIIFGSIGVMFVSAAAVPPMMNVGPGGLSIFVCLPFAFIAFFAAKAKLARDAR
ncbi:MAG TPA: hypothetical protein VGI08_10890 [Diaminobutyricibacter sp.]